MDRPARSVVADPHRGRLLVGALVDRDAQRDTAEDLEQRGSGARRHDSLAGIDAKIRSSAPTYAAATAGATFARNSSSLTR